jgi:cell division protein FtsZ
VIWGTATDDSLGEDAKVTILATGMENELRKDIQADIHRDEDDFYEDLIPLLYKPTKIETMGKIIGKEQELDFKVEEAKNPEPAVEPEPIVGEQIPDIEPEAEPIEEPKLQTIVEKWKGWLNNLMKDVIE